MRIHLPWLIILVALTLIFFQSLVYTTAVNSSICSLGIGICTGTFTINGIFLNHEYLGIGLLLAAALLKASPLRFGLFGVGLVLILSDLGDTFTQTIAGASISLALGLAYGLSFSETFHEDRLKEVEV